MRKSHILILTFLFGLLSLISLIGVYFAHQVPTEEKSIITLCTYGHNGIYDYTAQLKPNIFYNKTTLRPGEGTLYTKITELVNVTFAYTFSCNLPANGTLQHVINEHMQSQRWNRSLVTSPTETLTFSETTEAGFAANWQINITALEELKNSVDKETGTYTSDFSLVIEPKIQVAVTTSAGAINEVFNPNIIINFRYRTAEGDYIAIEGLTHTKQGSIQQTEITHHPEVMNQRYVSYAFSIAFLSAFLITAGVYAKAKPEKPKPEKPIEEIIAPYEEMIFELAEEPHKTPETTTVKTKSLADLISIADGLAKPVLHLKKTPSKPGEKTTHMFIVVDGSVRYEYGYTEPKTSGSAG